MKRILIAPNSFKECAYSTDVSRLITDSLEKSFCGDSSLAELVQFPVSDGGDGFLEVIKEHFKTETKFFKLTPITGGEFLEYAVEYSADKKTVFIESAKIIGLKLVPIEKRNPLNLNTEALGELLIKINSSDIDVESVVIGIGGTATNDLGIGMLSRFGLQLYDFSGSLLLPVPAHFASARNISLPEFGLRFKIVLVTDVENPLLGEKGAARVFAGQKGADEESIIALEQGFSNLLNILQVDEGIGKTLSGAGGGLAAAFQLFFNPVIINAREFILRYLCLESKKDDFYLVITGEGTLDGQTLLNKGAFIISEYFMKKCVPVCFICGENKLYRNPELLDIIELRDFFSSKEESISRFSDGIETACRAIVNKYFNKI